MRPDDTPCGVSIDKNVKGSGDEESSDRIKIGERRYNCERVMQCGRV